MVQWFKHLYRLLFRLPQPRSPLLQFNVAALQRKQQHVAIDLYRHRSDDAFKLATEMIELMRNEWMLAVLKLPPGNSVALAQEQGRLQGLESVLTRLEDCTNEATYRQLVQGRNQPKEKPLRREASRAEAVI